MKKYFTGKTALVTGAGWGIGAATALLYAAYGAKVVVSETSRIMGNNTVAKIKSNKGDATFIRADVSKPAECELLIKQTTEIYGSIDIACNNAGIFGESRYPAEKDLEAYDREADDSFNGLFYYLKYEIEAMQKQGGGVIVNIASILGAISLASFSPYADETYSAGGICINAVTPAFISTALLENTNSEKRALLKSSPMGKLGKMEKIAGLVMWLSSDEAPFASII
jgi:NAD(P)-dependent dehydrogenase (short-subunit alcohol dehydrogenase family)